MTDNNQSKNQKKKVIIYHYDKWWNFNLIQYHSFLKIEIFGKKFSTINLENYYFKLYNFYDHNDNFFFQKVYKNLFIFVNARTLYCTINSNIIMTFILFF